MNLLDEIARILRPYTGAPEGEEESEAPPDGGGGGGGGNPVGAGRTGARKSRSRRQSDWIAVDPSTGAFIQESPSTLSSQGADKSSKTPPVTLEQFELRIFKDTKRWNALVNCFLSSTEPHEKRDAARLTVLALLDAVDEFFAALASRQCVFPPAQFQEAADATESTDAAGSGYAEQYWLAHLLGTNDVMLRLVEFACKLGSRPDAAVETEASMTNRLVRLFETRLFPLGCNMYREWHQKRRDDIIGVAHDGFWPTTIRKACLMIICNMTWSWNHVIFPWLRQFDSVLPETQAAGDHGHDEEQPDETDNVLDMLDEMSLQTWGEFYDRSAVLVNDAESGGSTDVDAVTSMVQTTLVTWFGYTDAVGVPLRARQTARGTATGVDPAHRLSHCRLLSEHQQARRFLSLAESERLWRAHQTSVVDLEKRIKTYTLVDCVRVIKWFQRHQFCLEWTPLLEWLLCVGIWSRVCYYLGCPDLADMTFDDLEDYEMDDNVWQPIQFDPTHLTVNEAVFLELERTFCTWLGITELSYRFLRSSLPLPGGGGGGTKVDEIRAFAETIDSPTPSEQYEWASVLLSRYVEYRPSINSGAGAAMESRDLLGERLKTGSLGYLIHPKQLESHVERGGAVASRAFLDVLGASRNIDRNAFMYVIYHDDGFVYLVVSSCCENERDALELYEAILAPDMPLSSAPNSSDLATEVTSAGYEAETARATQRTLRLAFHAGPLISRRIKSECYPRLLPFVHQQVLEFGNLRNTYTELSSDPDLMAAIAEINQSAAKDANSVAAMEAAKRDNYMSVLMDVAHRTVKLLALADTSKQESGGTQWQKFRVAAKQAIANTAKALGGQRRAPATQGGQLPGAASGTSSSHTPRTFQSNVINVHYALRSMGSLQTVRDKNYLQKLRFALEPQPYSSLFFGTNTSASGLDTDPTRGKAENTSSTGLAPRITRDPVTGSVVQVTCPAPSTHPFLISIGYDNWVILPNVYYVRTRDYLYALKIYANLAKFLGVYQEIVDPVTRCAFLSSLV